jgi:hypothetical protein
MTQEEKELLLKDLSARLPYGVLCDMGLEYPLPLQRIFVDRLDGILLDFYEDGDDYQVYLTEVKPHLRPMSSMTDEELNEMKALCSIYIPTDSPTIGFEDYGILVFTHHLTNNTYSFKLNIDIIDWLNKNMFDYRGLIDKGLAVKATEKDLKMIFKIISFLLS